MEDRICPHCNLPIPIDGDASREQANCPQCGGPLKSEASAASEPIVAQVVPELSDRDAYNIVTDLAVGPNLRRSDNIFQLKTIVICLLGGAGIGALVGGCGGAFLGAFAGILVGLFGSGIYLMVYRAVRHVRGRHD